MAHQAGERRFVERSGRFAVDTFLTNEGTGAAFNVRFGVEFHGVRFPYKHAPEDDQAGTVYRVVGSGKRLPDPGSWPLEVEALVLLGARRENPDPTRVFWARYENAQGRLWETRNPGNRSGRLGIKRIRARRLHEWWEQRQRTNALKRGATFEQTAVAELLAMSESPKE